MHLHPLDKKVPRDLRRYFTGIQQVKMIVILPHHTAEVAGIIQHLHIKWMIPMRMTEEVNFHLDLFEDRRLDSQLTNKVVEQPI